jgi:hypothetical protein
MSVAARARCLVRRSHPHRSEVRGQVSGLNRSLGPHRRVGQGWGLGFRCSVTGYPSVKLNGPVLYVY